MSQHPPIHRDFIRESQDNPPEPGHAGCGWFLFACIVTWLAAFAVGWYLWDMAINS